MEPSESYEVIHYIPAPSLPYSQPGSCYTLVRLPDDDPTAGRNSETLPYTCVCKVQNNNFCAVFTKTVSHLSTVSCTFSCTMKYLVRDCDPNTGEPDDDGYDDEYVVRNHSTSANCVFNNIKSLFASNSSLLVLPSFSSSPALLSCSWRTWR